MNPFVVGSIASGALSGLGSVVGGLFSARNQDKANAANVRMQSETNQLNRYLAEHQFSLAASDMERAGLSKNLAAGTPMSLPAINAAQQQSLGDFDGDADGFDPDAEAEAESDFADEDGALADESDDADGEDAEESSEAVSEEKK